jgi:hypothetical protein
MLKGFEEALVARFIIVVLISRCVLASDQPTRLDLGYLRGAAESCPYLLMAVALWRNVPFTEAAAEVSRRQCFLQEALWSK